jgi:GGDEF domain-containing protein
MSDDYRTEPVFRTTMIQQEAGRDQGDGRRRRLPAHAYEDPARKSDHGIDDAASVLGLSADLITPKVLSAIAPLLSELDRLRLSGEQAQHRLNWLEQQSDRHSVVPCLTRRAFMREMDSFMAGQGRGVVCLIQVAGIEALRQLHGLAAGEGALRHVCANIIGALRNSDLVGCLGGSDFAVLLPGTARDGARAKMDEIVGHMIDPPYRWLGQRIPLTPAWGVHEVQPGEGAEQAVAAADRHRRGLV